MIEVVGCPPGRLAADGLELLGIASPQALDLGLPRLALERDDDGAVLEGVGEPPDGGDRLWRPSREPPRLMLPIYLDVADDVGGDPCMSGI
jgi:hypothetical protein